jgi:hypothetical protein
MNLWNSEGAMYKLAFVMLTPVGVLVLVAPQIGIAIFFVHEKAPVVIMTMATVG